MAQRFMLKPQKKAAVEADLSTYARALPNEDGRIFILGLLNEASDRLKGEVKDARDGKGASSDSLLVVAQQVVDAAEMCEGYRLALKQEEDEIAAKKAKADAPLIAGHAKQRKPKLATDD